MGGRPKLSAPAAPPPPPEEDSPEAQRAAAEARANVRRRRGRAATILTSPGTGTTPVGSSGKVKFGD